MIKRWICCGHMVAAAWGRTGDCVHISAYADDVVSTVNDQVKHIYQAAMTPSFIPKNKLKNA